MTKHLPTALLMAFAGLSSLAAAHFIMENGHLHEDAYILFQYSKKLAAGHGIAFDSTSGPMEGATDFLWMVFLSGLSKLVDLGTGASILNALGIACIAYTIIQLRERVDALSICAIFAVIISGGFSAAMGGFSTLAYGGLYSALTLFALKRNYPATTIFAILISLFRPDGVILAAGTLTALAIFSSKQERIKWVAMTSVITITGLTYFIWRWNYFEAILPLPLLIKQKTDYFLEGLDPDIRATIGYMPLLIATLFFWRQTNPSKLLIITLGPGILFVALSFAHQSQNIGYRFQFPIILAIIFSFLATIPKEKNKNYAITAMLFLFGIAHGAKMIASDASYLTSNDYINNFPQLLKRSRFKVESIAITEAGRFPFWLDTDEMIDLVGLNSRGVVFNGAEHMLQSSKPQLVFVNHADRYKFDETGNNTSYFMTTPEKISLNEYAGKNPLFIAPEAALKYAKENNFVAVPVRYGPNDGNFSHVYFLSKNLDISKFLAQLSASTIQKTTYYSSIAED